MQNNSDSYAACTRVYVICADQGRESRRGVSLLGIAYVLIRPPPPPHSLGQSYIKVVFMQCV